MHCGKSTSASESEVQNPLEILSEANIDAIVCVIGSSKHACRRRSSYSCRLFAHILNQRRLTVLRLNEWLPATAEARDLAIGEQKGAMDEKGGWKGANLLDVPNDLPTDVWGKL
jgi:hypothetical protein